MIYQVINIYISKILIRFIVSLISEYKGQSHKRDGNGRNEGERRVLMPSDSLHTGHHALACHIQDGVFLCSCNAAASAVSPHSPLLLPSFRREMLSRMPYGQINSVTYHKSMCAFFSLHLQFPSLTRAPSLRGGVMVRALPSTDGQSKCEVCLSSYQCHIFNWSYRVRILLHVIAFVATCSTASHFLHAP